MPDAFPTEASGFGSIAEEIGVGVVEAPHVAGDQGLIAHVVANAEREDRRKRKLKLEVAGESVGKLGVVVERLEPLLALERGAEVPRLPVGIEEADLETGTPARPAIGGGWEGAVRVARREESGIECEINRVDDQTAADGHVSGNLFRHQHRNLEAG